MADDLIFVKPAPSLRDLIKRFANEHRGRLWRLTATSSRFADLLTAFPGAAVAIAALPRDDAAGAEALRLVDAGAPLATIADALAIPLWFRRLPAESFRMQPVWPAAFGCDEADPVSEARTGARLLNLLPRSRMAAGPWLATVAEARAAGGDEFAIWVAGLQGVWKRSAQCLPVRVLALYYWHSRRPAGEAGRLIGDRWQPSMGVSRAAGEARRWLLEALRHGCGCDFPLIDIGRRSWQLDDLRILPLTTPAEILLEARAMRNCLPQYIAPVMAGQCRLYGYRRGEAHIATLEVRLCETTGRPYRKQLCGYRNADPADNLLAATDAWIAREAAALRREFLADFGRHSESLFRELVWRPYALAGGLSSDHIAEPAIADILREMEGLGAYEK